MPALPHEFADPALLELALTHASTGASADNERLEFLGDAALDLIVAEELFRTHADLAEGELTELKSHVVSRPALARAARVLELEPAARIGLGLRRSALPASVLANLYEALLGAVYLDGGFEPARAVVLHLLGDRIESAGNKPVDKDPKTALQELLQGRGLALPRYAVQKTEGEAHDQTFIVECRVDDLGTAATGRGASRRAAEQAAAEAVLALLEKTPKKKSK
jgi:ribonuclease-3